MSLRLRSLCLLLAIALAAGPAAAQPEPAPRPGPMKRLGTWLQQKEQQALTFAARPGVKAHRYLLKAKLFRTALKVTTGLARSTPAKERVWIGSSLSLGSVEASEALPAAGKLTGLETIGMGAGVALAAVATHDLIKAKNANERLDAGGDLAWGLQGALAYSGRELLGKVALGAGFVGAVCQTAVGCRRIIKGLREHDRKQVKLGLLDTAGGLGWLAWDLTGATNPFFIAGYTGVMLAREAYANREALNAFGKRTMARASCAFGRCKARIAERATHLRERTAAALRHMAAGLFDRPAR